MTTPVLVTGFEGFPAVILTNGGGLSRTMTGVAPQIEVNAAAALTGTYGLKIAPTASLAARWESMAYTAGAQQVGSINVKFSTLPTADVVLLQGEAIAGAANPSIIFNNSTGKLAVSTGNSDNTSIANKVDFGVVVSTGVKYRIDWHFDVSASTWVLKAKLDGANEGTTSPAAFGVDTIDAVRLGHTGTSGPAHTTYWDDVIISATLADYPIGAHGVERLAPASDGTHNAGTNIMENQAGADIGVVTAYDKINSVPPDSTTYIKQVANGTGNYAEVNFGNITATHNGIIGAEAYLTYTSSATQANRGACEISKDAWSTNTVLFGDIGGTTVDYSDGSTSNLFYKSIIVAGVTDDTTVNALQGRVC